MNQHDIAGSVKMRVGVEFPDHCHICHARLITQLLPSEPAYVILQISIAGLESEVTIYMSRLGVLYSTYKVYQHLN